MHFYVHCYSLILLLFPPTSRYAYCARINKCVYIQLYNLIGIYICVCVYISVYEQVQKVGEYVEHIFKDSLQKAEDIWASLGITTVKLNEIIYVNILKVGFIPFIYIYIYQWTIMYTTFNLCIGYRSVYSILWHYMVFFIFLKWNGKQLLGVSILLDIID